MIKSVYALSAGGETWTPTWSPMPDPKSGPSTNSGTPAMIKQFINMSYYIFIMKIQDKIDKYAWLISGHLNKKENSVCIVQLEW